MLSAGRVSSTLLPGSHAALDFRADQRRPPSDPAVDPAHLPGPAVGVRLGAATGADNRKAGGSDGLPPEDAGAMRDPAPGQGRGRTRRRWSLRLGSRRRSRVAAPGPRRPAIGALAVSSRSPLLENGAGRCGALVEQPVRLRLVRNLLLRQAMEGRPQASAQLLACGDPIAAGGGDEEDL